LATPALTWEFPVGRAGLDPATLGLKVHDQASQGGP